jgi:hypothetical protein
LSAQLGNRGRGRLISAAIFALFFAAAGCRDAILSLSSPKPRADELFAALGARVSDPQRERKYDYARIQIANAAVLPSRVWSDTAVWTASTSVRRTLVVGGRYADGRYHLMSERAVPHPTQLAESRHIINLTRLSDDEYVWDTDVIYALGGVSAEQVGRFVGAMFASAEGRGERDVRADYGTVLPRASAVLGQLFAVDSVRTTHFADKSTLAAFTVRLTPRGIESRYPNFAKYMARYGETTRAHWTLTDHTGASYFDLTIGDGRLIMRVRTLDGAMVSLGGAARAMPDSLTLNGDMTFKVRAFTVGIRNYHAEFTIVHTDDERTWNIVSRREPEWVLPLITERLLRTPLRRPFQGNGTLFRIGVRDSAGAPTLLHRRLHLEVQESTLLRFIGKLGATAVNDFTGKAEREQYLWLREFFTALVGDVHAATAASPPRPLEP